MTKIALLCPTRGRPEQFKRMCESAHATGEQFYIYAYLTEDDPSWDEYQALKLGFEDDVFWMHGPDYPTVHKWNMLAGKAMRSDEVRLFMLGADDMVFSTDGWDKAILDDYEKRENKIHCYALQDSRDKDGTPHIFVTREWIEALGYAFMPIFCHFYVDTWTVAIAKANKCFTHMRDYLLVHDKSNDKGTPDGTHLRIRKNGTHERDSYVNETCQHFLEYEKHRLELRIAQMHFPNLAPKCIGDVYPELGASSR